MVLPLDILDKSEVQVRYHCCGSGVYRLVHCQHVYQYFSVPSDRRILESIWTGRILSLHPYFLSWIRNNKSISRCSDPLHSLGRSTTIKPSPVKKDTSLFSFHTWRTVSYHFKSQPILKLNSPELMDAVCALQA